MRRITVSTFASLALLAGCQSEREIYTTDEQRELRVSMINMLSNIQTDNSVIAQHTIYPWHFESDSAQLNPLGERDLEVLATHFFKYGGQLSVRQAGASEELYGERVNAVRNYLTASGVEAFRIAINDGLPGGPGLESDTAINILEAESGEEGQRSSSMGPASLAGGSKGGQYVTSNR